MEAYSRLIRVAASLLKADPLPSAEREDYARKTVGVASLCTNLAKAQDWLRGQAIEVRESAEALRAVLHRLESERDEARQVIAEQGASLDQLRAKLAQVEQEREDEKDAALQSVGGEEIWRYWYRQFLDMRHERDEFKESYRLAMVSVNDAYDKGKAATEQDRDRLAGELVEARDRIISNAEEAGLSVAALEVENIRLAAEVEQVKDVGAAFKQANEEMHEMIMQIRRRFKAWDTPYSPVGQDIVDCIIRHADEELTAAQEENKRLKTTEPGKLIAEIEHEYAVKTNNLIERHAAQLTTAQQSAQEQLALREAAQEVAEIFLDNGGCLDCDVAKEQFKKGMERACEIAKGYIQPECTCRACDTVSTICNTIQAELSKGEGK